VFFKAQTRCYGSSQPLKTNQEAFNNVFSCESCGESRSKVGRGVVFVSLFLITHKLSSLSLPPQLTFSPALAKERAAFRTWARVAPLLAAAARATYTAARVIIFEMVEQNKGTTNSSE
jgi:hypothetical protein